MDSWYKELVCVAGDKNVKIDEDMGRHTTFKTGGQAKYFIIPDNKQMLLTLIQLHFDNHMPYYIIGNGSNLLIADEGYDGTIIKIGEKMSRITIDNLLLKAESGAMLSKIAAMAAKNSLTGLEFAAGIPGSVGGAAAMNAGAYGGEIKNLLLNVEVMDHSGHVMTLLNEELKYGYRSSEIQSKEYIVLSVELKLSHGNEQEILEKMNEFMKARKDKQPLEYPSAGSTFKRPNGHFAGKLIMDAGLAGYSIGGACVSEKHCGFVINKSNATATDIITLMKNVNKIVFEKFGVILEPEVKIIGDRTWREL